MSAQDGIETHVLPAQNEKAAPSYSDDEKASLEAGKEDVEEDDFTPNVYVLQVTLPPPLQPNLGLTVWILSP